MKSLLLRLLITGLSFLGGLTFLMAQVPAGFQYQAVARDANGNALKDQTVSLRLSLLPGSETANPVYTETHNVTTNSFGLVTIHVGSGNVVTGDFESIDWGSTSMYLKVGMDQSGGSNYSDMGTSRLLSVPYALLSASSKGVMAGTSIEIASEPDAGDDDPIFEVKNRDGQVVLGVYQTGVRIYVDSDDEEKGSRGGFAVGGFTTQKGDGYEFLRVDPGYVRVSVDDGTSDDKEQAEGKGSRAGFAVGGFTGQTKENPRDLMFIAPDSARIWVNSDEAKGSRGGFAVGGYTQGKSTPSNFILLTPENYLVGHESGFQTTTGLYNSFFGYKSGYSNTEGSYNVFMGRMTGYSNASGSSNIFIGDSAGYDNINGYANVMIGDKSGTQNTTGYWNVFLGRYSGHTNLEGYANLFAGDFAGYSNTNGHHNVFLGDYAGGNNTDGENNIFVGTESGWSNLEGNWNVFMGDNSGYGNKTGVSNVVIGQSAGLEMDTANYNVSIGTWSGASNFGGKLNVFLGQQSGQSNTIGNYNTFLGSVSGNNNTTGGNNVFTGSYSGFSNTSGEFNAFLGTSSGYSNTLGSQNAFIGQQAGYSNDNGSLNTYLGTATGYSNQSGSGNVAVGNRAGYYNESGEFNVFIGNRAGFNELGSNKLYIANSDTDIPLIYGDFNSGRIGLGTSSPSEKLHVKGKVVFEPGIGIYEIYKIHVDVFDNEPAIRPTHSNWGYLGSSANYWYRTYTNEIYRTNEYSLSDVMAKKNIQALGSSLDKILELNGYSYSLDKSFYQDSGKSGKNNDEDTRNLGFIAQELMKIIPEMVVLDPETGLYMIRNYEQLFPVIVEAIKEQQMIIGNQGKAVENINYQPSDIRWKTNILPLEESLSRIVALNGVSFDWRINEFPKKNFKQGQDLGFVAQDVEKIIPEIVSTDGDGYKSIEYYKLVPEIVEAIKEQQKIIDQQNSAMDRILRENEDLRKRYLELKSAVDKMLMDNISKVEPPPLAP